MAEYYGIHYDSVIEHHGIKGQKWGVRRYQNKDGTLTEEGKRRINEVTKSYDFTLQKGTKLYRVSTDSKDPTENASRNVMGRTETGKMFTQKLLDLGYDAIVDVHGYNVADAPVIILNADKNLKRRKVLATYTAPVANEIRKGSLKL